VCGRKGLPFCDQIGQHRFHASRLELHCSRSHEGMNAFLLNTVNGGLCSIARCNAREQLIIC
jgi:hypothetical protein